MKNNSEMGISIVMTMGNITPTMDIPEMDRWERLILNLICLVSTGNELSITWVQSCIRIHSH